jgi:hypothetical protein
MKLSSIPAVTTTITDKTLVDQVYNTLWANLLIQDSEVDIRILPIHFVEAKGLVPHSPNLRIIYPTFDNTSLPEGAIASFKVRFAFMIYRSDKVLKVYGDFTESSTPLGDFNPILVNSDTHILTAEVYKQFIAYADDSVKLAKTISESTQNV